MAAASPVAAGEHPAAKPRAEVDAFLEALRGTLYAEQPSDVNAFVRTYCSQRVTLTSLSVAEQAALLCRAAAHGDVTELTALLDKGLNPSMVDYDLRTPLHLAAEELRLPCVQLLLERRADVNAMDRWGSTPLAGVEAHVALGEDDGMGEDIMEALKRAGGRLREEYYLVDGDSTPCERSWGLSHKPPVSEAPALGKTLQLAASQGDIAEVRRMLDGGSACVSSANCDGRTALHLASENGHLELVKLLVERRADVEAKDNWGATPMHGAEQHSHFKVACFLEDQGARRLPPQEKPLSHHARVARSFWDERLCSEAGVAQGAESVPGAALRRVLQRDFGFDFARHRVLEGEVRRLEDAGGAVARAEFLRAALMAPRAAHRAGGLESSPLRMRSSRRLRPGEEGGLDRYRSIDTIDDAESADDGDEEEQTHILSRVVLGKLAIGHWKSFVEIVRKVFTETAADEALLSGPLAGENADYIPELRDAPSDRLAISICTVDGQMCGFGDCDEFFSVQSTGKSFAYSLAMKENTRAHDPKHEGPEGKAYVHQFVGQEPSGRAFNDFALTRADANGKEHPFNPVTNAGAIVTCSMIDQHNPLPIVPGDARSERMESRIRKYKDFLSELCGGEEIGDCMDVFTSEQSEAFNNYALANFMRARGTFPPSVRTHDQLRECVDFYLRVCSSRVNTRLLSIAAATYATFGTCPLTGRTALPATNAKQTLAILSSCGMYDFSGEWACTVGLPAKSGVSGNIIIVVPGIIGLSVWSPRLDALGNSVRGVRMAQKLKDHLSCSLLDLLARVHR